MMILYATSVAFGDQALALRGPSGSGKSDLALRLMENGASLVADDRTVLERRGACLLASPPAALRGRLEVRGVGVVNAPWRENIPLALLVELSRRAPPRMPEPRWETLLGVKVAVAQLRPFEASAAPKLRWALKALPTAMLAS